jgi:hypothetical protein
MLGLLFCSAIATASATNGPPVEPERPTQAYAHALIAEMHIARGEWKAAEDALRYALIFDYDDRYLRRRLLTVLTHQGKRAALAQLGRRGNKPLRLPPRLSERIIDGRGRDPSVAEK